MSRSRRSRAASRRSRPGPASTWSTARSYPTRLTPAGETFHAQALEILGALQATRNMMRSHQAAGQDMIEFAVPHTLAFTFFPHWVMDLRAALRRRSRAA